METQFSDEEFSDILGAFAEVDDMLIGWDVLMTPVRGDEASTQAVDQQVIIPTNGSLAFLSENFLDKFIEVTSTAPLGDGSNSQGLDASRPAAVGMPRMLPAGLAHPDTCVPELLQYNIQNLQPSPGVPHQVESLSQVQMLQELQRLQSPGRHPGAQMPVGQDTAVSNQILFAQQQIMDYRPHIEHVPQQQPQEQGLLQRQQCPAEPPLPYLVQTPSSSLTADQSSGTTLSGSPARGSMDISTAAVSLAAVGSNGGGGGCGSGSAAISNLSGVSEHDGDGGGCWSSTLSLSAALQPQLAMPNFGATNTNTTVGSGSASRPGAALSAPLIQLPKGALITTGVDGTVVWAPVAHLPPVNPTGLAGPSSMPTLTQPAHIQPGLVSQALTKPAVAAPAQLLAGPTGTDFHSEAATDLMGCPGYPGQALCGQGPGQQIEELGTLGAAVGTCVDGGMSDNGHSDGVVAPLDLASASGPASACVPAAWGALWAPGQSAGPASCVVTLPNTVPPSAAGAPTSLVTTTASFPRATSSRHPTSATLTAAAAAAAPSLPQIAAASGKPIVSGSALLAELIAEAASGGWAAVATGLAPLPPSTGRTAEELLSGLDLQEVFAPQKPSHAKRIRGHVRRAAELRAQLADRVRAIQRLAAENADLRGRAKVLELVVRCRDEQLRLLRNYRTSEDGRVYYIEQPGGLSEGAEEQGGPGAAIRTVASYIGTNAAALATMPVGGLLEMLRKMCADVSMSLVAVEADANHPATAASLSLTANPTCGSVGSAPTSDVSFAATATAPPPPPPLPRLPSDISTSASDKKGVELQTLVAGPSSPLARLRGQMAVLRNVLRYLGLVNEEACKFAFTTLTGDVAVPEPGHWLRVVQALGLSLQQLADAAALHSCWQDWLARIHSERRSIAAALDQLLSVNRYGATYLESVGQYGTDRDVIHKMHANVMRERILMVLTGEVFCCHILTDLQWARAVVKSYPYIIDVREVARAASQLYYSSIRGLMPGGLGI